VIGSLPRGGRAAAAVLISATLLATGACAAGQGIVQGALRAGRVVLPGEQDILAPALLTRMDLQDAGLPPELLQRTFEEVPLYENPDPRGPCGGTADDPGFDRAASAVFATDDARLLFAQTIYDLPPGEAQRQVHGFRADLRPACPPFVSKSPFGPQRVELMRPVEMGPFGDDHVGTLSRVTTRDGEQTYVMTELVRVGNRLVVLQAIDAIPFLDVEMRSLAKEAVAKLQALR
jgi:hypothetical protein